MQLDERAINFIKKAKESGATKSQVAEFLRNKGYDVVYNQEQDEEGQSAQQQAKENANITEQQPEEKSPGLIKGFSDKAANALAIGQGSRIAGFLNTAPGRAFETAINPIGALLKGQAKPTSLEYLSPSKIAEQYQQGKQQYESEQQTFEKEHPTASMIAEGVGTVGGFLLPAGAVGGAVKGLVAASKLGKAGRIGMLASRAAGEMTAGAVYEGIREGFGEGRADAEAALEGTKKGAITFGALGILGGGARIAEESLVSTATKLAENPSTNKILRAVMDKVASHPVASQRGAMAAGLVAEGTTLGALPAYMNDQEITAKDIGTGLAFAAGGRGAAEVASWAGGKLRKFVNEPTKMQVEEARARAKEISTAKEKVEEATAEEISATKERRALQSQGASKRAVLEAKKTEDWWAAERNKAEQDLSDIQSGAKKDLELDVKVSATDKEIADYMKSHSKNPYMTEEKAAFNIRQAKERAARQIAPEEKLPTKERFLRKSKELAGKFIGQFNLNRPLQEGITKAEMVTGTKVAADKNPVIRLNKLRNGGEQEALIAPVFDKAKSIEKQYPGSIDGADIVLDAEKRIQFDRNAGKEPEQRFLDIVQQYKDDAPVQDIVKEVRALNQKALDRLYDSGRIDKATYENWKKNDAYVPSWIEKYDEAGEQTVGNLREQYLRQYTGEGDVYKNPIVTSMQQARQLDTFAELQTAKKEYLELASKTGDATKVPSTTEYKGGPVKFDKDNQIVVWKDGQPEIWNVPERVAQYFNPEKQGVDSLPVKVAKALFGFPLRVFKGGTTAVSLGFSQNNIVRDVQGAVIGSKNGAYIGPDMIRSSMKELVEEAPIAKELGKQIGTQTLRDVEQLPGLAKDNIKNFVDMYKAIDKAGGEGTQRGLIARLFTTALPNGARKLARVSSKTAKSSLNALSYAGNLGEETTRLSVFKSELKAAAQDQAQYDMWIANPDTIPSELKARAGEAAREVTLNFRRQMAPWVENANRYFLPYFKPSILGAMRGFEVLTNPEIAPKAWRTIMNLGMIQGLINGKIVDKKQIEELDAYNNEMAGKNFLMRNKNGTLITIPLAQEFAPLVKMFAGVTEWLYRKANKQQRKDVFREMKEAGKQMLENYIPGVGYFTEPSNLVVGQIPKAVVEEWVNKDIFSGAPIVSEYLMNRPASMQYTKSTPQTLVQASKLLAKRGVEISPMRLNHIAKTFGSNTAKEMLALTDTALEANGIGELRPRKEITDNPLVRRFVANLMAPYNQYNQDARRIIEENKGGYELIKNKEIEGLSKQQKAKYVKQYIIYRRAENSINNLNQLRRKRKDIERRIAMIGNALKTQYDKGKIDKEEYLIRRNKRINAFNTVLDTQNQLERQFQLEIIKAAENTKKK